MFDEIIGGGISYQRGILLGNFRNSVLSLQKKKISPHWNRNTYSLTRFSLITFSYGHWIPPQGKVQSDRSSYDNIIVRTVKGQTTAHVLFYVASAERTHRWLQHCCRASTAKCLWEGDKCQWRTRPSFHPYPLRFLPLAPAHTLVWNFSLLDTCASVACVQKCVRQQKLLCTCCLRHPRGISE